jgi:hypothetical protein
MQQATIPSAKLSIAKQRDGKETKKSSSKRRTANKVHPICLGKDFMDLPDFPCAPRRSYMD